jgi:hypothetical protein
MHVIDLRFLRHLYLAVHISILLLLAVTRCCCEHYYCVIPTAACYTRHRYKELQHVLHVYITACVYNCICVNDAIIPSYMSMTMKT